LLSESPLPLGRRKAKKKRQLSNKDVDVDMKDCFEVDTDVLMEDSSPVVHTDVLMEDVSVVDSSVKREVPSSSTLTTPSISSGSLPVPNPVKFYNLAVKQKAVYQPAFKHRRWMEEQKALVPLYATRSIADIESSMPPLRGEGASLLSYYQELESM